MNANNENLPDWVTLRGTLLEDIARKGGGGRLDLVDLRGYDMAFVRLEEAFRAGTVNADSAEVYDIRVGIRDHEFRPTYSQVSAIIAKVLRVSAVPFENPNAYRPVMTPAVQSSTRGRQSEARDRARTAIKSLNERGPQKAFTVEDALKWVPSPLPGCPADPITAIPGDDRDVWIRRAYRDLYDRKKGRAPLAVRHHAVHLYRLSLIEQESAEEEAKPRFGKEIPDFPGAWRGDDPFTDDNPFDNEEAGE